MRVESPGKLLLGLGTGVTLGALLQKGRAAKYEVIVDQLCPGMTLAAIGEGRRDAIAGAPLPEATHTSPWPWIAGMAAALIAGAAYGALRGSRP
jgi:hypothetical protein